MANHEKTADALTGICPAVVSICRPLFKTTPIKHFGYQEIHSNGDFYFMNSNTEHYRKWIKSKLYDSLVQKQMKIVKHKGMIIQDLSPNKKTIKEELSQMLEILSKKGFGHFNKNIMTISEGNLEKCCIFNFNGSLGDTSINHFYLNNSNLINYFCQHFYHEIQPYLKKIPPYTVCEQDRVSTNHFVKNLTSMTVPIGFVA